MSLSGIRSMSTIEEPPEDRYPVQTYVLEQDDSLIREIILREIERGGQVFCVFNRVKGINQITDGLRQLVPEARIKAAHGQMAEGKLEDIMQEDVYKRQESEPTGISILSSRPRLSSRSISR